MQIKSRPSPSGWACRWKICLVTAAGRPPDAGPRPRCNSRWIASPNYRVHASSSSWKSLSRCSRSPVADAHRDQQKARAVRGLFAFQKADQGPPYTSLPRSTLTPVSRHKNVIDRLSKKSRTSTEWSIAFGATRRPWYLFSTGLISTQSSASVGTGPSPLSSTYPRSGSLIHGLQMLGSETPRPFTRTASLRLATKCDRSEITHCPLFLS